VVLDAYTIALRYAHDKDRAFDVAVRAWRLHNRSFPPDVAAREVAAIIQNKQAGSDRPNAVVHGKIGPASSLRRQP